MTRVCLLRPLVLAASLVVCQAPPGAAAQRLTALAAMGGTSVPRFPPQLLLGDRAYWFLAGGTLVSSVFLDRTVEPAIHKYQTPFLNHIAPLGDIFGEEQYTVPAVAVSVVAAQLAGSPHWEDGTRHIALTYAVADVSEGLLKFLVGRQRPSYSGDPENFDPLSFSDEWHSFPSGHLTHITAIAAAFAEEVHQPWATAVSATVVAFTGWQRMYRARHWFSDVIGGVVIGTAASRATAHWFRHDIRTGD
jgi:membrane-associated phospholipid phosphatase